MRTSDLAGLAHRREFEETKALIAIRKKYAKRYLELMRAHLKPFNLSRHNVKISSGMGSACLTVNDEFMAKA